MVHSLECICKYFEEINGFFSPREFQRFEKYIDDLVNGGEIKEVPVIKSLGYGDYEKWFECSTCHEIWRLISPDYPFTGVWRKVD